MFNPRVAKYEIGDIIETTEQFTNDSWQLCNGAALSISADPTLMLQKLSSALYNYNNETLYRRGNSYVFSNSEAPEYVYYQEYDSTTKRIRMVTYKLGEGIVGYTNWAPGFFNNNESNPHYQYVYAYGQYVLVITTSAMSVNGTAIRYVQASHDYGKTYGQVWNSEASLTNCFDIEGQKCIFDEQTLTFYIYGIGCGSYYSDNYYNDSYAAINITDINNITGRKLRRGNREGYSGYTDTIAYKAQQLYQPKHGGIKLAKNPYTGHVHALVFSATNYGNYTYKVGITFLTFSDFDDFYENFSNPISSVTLLSQENDTAGNLYNGNFFISGNDLYIAYGRLAQQQLTIYKVTENDGLQFVTTRYSMDANVLPYYDNEDVYGVIGGSTNGYYPNIKYSGNSGSTSITDSSVGYSYFGIMSYRFPSYNGKAFISFGSNSGNTTRVSFGLKYFTKPVPNISLSYGYAYLKIK